MRKSYVYLLLRGIYNFFMTIYKRRSLYEAINLVFFEHLGDRINKFSSNRLKHRITPFNDLWAILCILLAYIGVTKFGVETTLQVFAASQIFSFTARVIGTVSIFVTKWFTSKIPQCILSKKKISTLQTSMK